MNCKDLDSVVIDLARDQMMEVRVREAALSHATSCPGCARRLEDARALTAGLRRVASAERGEAPLHIEESLIAAFLAHHHKTPRLETPGSIPIATRRWLYVAAGVAAVAVMVILISLMVSRTRDSLSPVQEQAVDAPPSHPSTSPERGQAKPATPHRENIVSSDKPSRRQRGTQAKRAPRTKPGEGDLNTEVEIATDFFPLVNRESLTELDSGQLVRVELPRSALMSFGLPMSMDRANDRVKADVVVGNDGLARAIRFVR
jgi:hypothetical protein